MNAQDYAELIQDWCSGSLPFADTKRLSDACTDETVRTALREQAHVHGLLRAATTPTLDLAPLVKAHIHRQRRRRRRVIQGLVAAAAGILLALGGGLLDWSPSARPENTTAVALAAPAWGTVLGTNGRPLILRAEEQLSADVGELQNGDRIILAENEQLRLTNAEHVSFDLRGPANCLLVEPELFELNHGTATVRIPNPRAQPVQITTPQGRIALQADVASLAVTAKSSRLQAYDAALSFQDWSGTRHVIPAGGSADLTMSTIAIRDPLPPIAPLPPLICRFDFEAIDGKEIPDVSGNGHRAWVFLRRPPVTGRHGQGLWCDGDAIMQVANHPDLRGDQGTCALWVKPHIGIPDTQDIAPNQPVEFWSMAEWEPKLGWEMLRTAEGPRDRWGLRLLRGPDDVVSLWSSIDNRREWMHLAATWGDGVIRLFIDGEQVGETDYGSKPTPAIGRNARVGTNIRGVIDDVRLYAEPLTPNQIKRIYRAAGAAVTDTADVLGPLKREPQPGEHDSSPEP